MYGIYIQCDACMKTIDGVEVTKGFGHVPSLGRFDGQKLREEAAKRGWTHKARDLDYCPEHANAYRIATPPGDG